MPTTYPKASPTEITGLLVLVNDHKGSEDLARLADDLDLELDEILPASDFAQALGLLRVKEGRATLTDVGRRLLAGSIRERKTLLREQLKRTTLYKAILRALDNSPEHRLTEDELYRLVEFTTAPADEQLQNIINWGRYAELFRYDAEARLLLPTRVRATGRLPPSGRSGPPGALPPRAGETEPAVPAPTGAPPDAVANVVGAFA